MLASYVVTKSAGPNTPHTAASVVARQGIKKNVQIDWKKMALIEIKVPDIGDFAEVTVTELMVKVGDTIRA